MDNLGSNLENNQIKTHFYQPDDEYQITTLFLSSDPRHTRSVHYWKWANSGRFNSDFISSVARFKNQIIGHYSLAGTPVKFGNQAFTAGFGQQAVTHKRFRSLSLLNDIYSKAYIKSKVCYDFLFAFPNDQFFPIKTQVFNWQAVSQFEAKVIQTQSIRKPTRSNYHIRQILKFQPETCVQNKNLSNLFFIPKSSELLNWRIFDHPINHYTVLGAYDNNVVLGYIILKLYESGDGTVGHFIDYETRNHDPDILAGLVSEAKSFFEFHNISKIIFWNTKKPYDTFFQPLLEKEGAFTTNFGIHLNNPDVPTDILNMENWSISMIDSDAF